MIREYLRLIRSRGRLIRAMRQASFLPRHKLIRQVEELGPWFHNFEVGEGVWTNSAGEGPGFDYPAVRWGRIADLLPEVKGKSCLDVGCSSGFFSLKLKELGAGLVVGVDDGEQTKAIGQARFAASQMGLDVRFEIMSVYDLDRLAAQFDLVLCMGVFYHLRHPLLALERLRSVCRGHLILQTITTRHAPDAVSELKPETVADVDLRSPVLMHESFPVMRFIEGTLGQDATCWFVPNPEAVFAMLRSCGFSVEEVLSLGHEVFVRARAR
jgi:tRNA (mo5U34)-methyltransferase